MLTISDIHDINFLPRLPDDPDEKCVIRFDFELFGIIFRSWKIRCKDGIHYSVSPPFVKHLGEKNNIIHFKFKDDFMELARNVIQAAKEQGYLKRGRQYDKR